MAAALQRRCLHELCHGHTVNPEPECKPEANFRHEPRSREGKGGSGRERTRKLWLGLGILLQGICLWSAPPVQAAGARVVQAIDLQATGAGDPALEVTASGAAGTAVPLGGKLYGDRIPPPDSLTSSLRWFAPWPNQAGCAKIPATLEATWRLKLPPERLPSGSASSPPQSDGTSVLPLPERWQKLLLSEAADQLLRVELDAARDALKDARQLLPCLEQVVTRDALRSQFVQEAVALATQGSAQTDQAFRQLLAVDPRLFLEPEHPPKVRKQFLAMAQQLLKEPPVSLDVSGLEGQLFLNGQEIQRQAEVHPGLHLLQMKGPTGKLRSALFTVEAGTKGKVVLRDRVDIGLPSASTAQSLLLQGLARGELTQSQREALDEWLLATLQTAAAFLVPPDSSTEGSASKRVSAVAYQKGTGIVPLTQVADSLPEGRQEMAPQGLFQLSAELRVGTGMTLSQQSGGTQTTGQQDVIPEVLGEAGLFASFGMFRVGGSLASRLDLTGAGSFVNLVGGGLAGIQLRLGPQVSLIPMLGYGGGSGPAVALSDCGHSTDGTAISCGAGAGASTVWLRSQVHGPMARMEMLLEARKGALRQRLNIVVGLQSLYALQSTLVPGSVTLEDGTTLAVQVDPSVKVNPLRVEGLAGIVLAF